MTASGRGNPGPADIRVADHGGIVAEIAGRKAELDRWPVDAERVVDIAGKIDLHIPGPNDRRSSLHQANSFARLLHPRVGSHLHFTVQNTIDDPALPMIVRNAISPFGLGVREQDEAMHRIAIELAALGTFVAQVCEPRLGPRRLKQLGKARAAIGNQPGG